MGALNTHSGADVLLDLACAFPNQRFDVLALAGAEPRYAARVRHRAAEHANVHVADGASYRDVVARVSTARLGLTAPDPHELFRAVQRGLEDDMLCAELRARARRHAEMHFDVRLAAQSCERLVEPLVSA